MSQRLHIRLFRDSRNKAVGREAMRDAFRPERTAAPRGNSIDQAAVRQ